MADQRVVFENEDNAQKRCAQRNQRADKQSIFNQRLFEHHLEHQKGLFIKYIQKRV